MKIKINIRKAQLSDLTQIRQLFFETITNVNVKDYNPEQIQVWSSGVNNIERWNKKFAEQVFVVAEIENKIVGFTSLFASYYVDYLYVSHLHQGEGIATRLMEYIEEIAKVNNTKQLKSDVSITARPFFENRGYKVVKKNEIPHLGQVLINFDVVKDII